MAKFVLELLDGYAETSLYLPTSDELVLLFSPSVRGYVSAGSRAYEAHDGRVAIPTHELPEGEFTPELVAADKKWTLPTLIRRGTTVYQKPYDDNDIRAVALDIKRMNEKIEKLIEDAKKIKEKIYGVRIL